MLFTQTESLRQMERLMQTVPRFRPKDHDDMVSRARAHTAGDCRCCAQDTGGKGKNRCALDRRERIAKRITAGTVTYREAVSETLSATRSPPLIRRLNRYLNESEDSPMHFQDPDHRTAFAEAMQKQDRKNRALAAALYLLTAEPRLWQTAKYGLRQDGLDRNAFRVKHCGVTAYTLLCAAKDLYLGTKHLTVTDLADPGLIPQKTFVLLCSAMAIRRFGADVVNHTERNGNKQGGKRA